MAASISCFLSSSTFCRVSFLSGSDSPCLAATAEIKVLNWFNNTVYIDDKKQQEFETWIWFFIPVWIFTRCSLEVNWSFTVNTCPFSISLDLGSLVRTLWVGFPQAKDCSARTSSLSGISVSCCISYITDNSHVQNMLNTKARWKKISCVTVQFHSQQNLKSC